MLSSLIYNTDLSEGSVGASFNPHYLIQSVMEAGLRNPVMGRATSQDGESRHYEQSGRVASKDLCEPASVAFLVPPWANKTSSSSTAHIPK